MDRSCAGSTINNYKRQFREKHGRDPKLTDDEVFHAIEEVGVGSSSGEQDEWTIEAMEEMEAGR